AAQAAEFDKAPDRDDAGSQRKHKTAAHVGSRALPAAEQARAEPEQQDPPAALVAVMQPFDADRETGPGQKEKQDESDQPEQQRRAGEAQQIVDVGAAEPDQAQGDEGGPDRKVNQH